jgi:hypothetical protein
MRHVFYNGRLTNVWMCADFDELPRYVRLYLAQYNCEAVGVVA